MRRHVFAAVGFSLSLLTLIFATVACSSAPDPTATPEPTAVIQPSPTPTPVPLTPDEVVENSIDSLVEAGSIWFCA